MQDTIVATDWSDANESRVYVWASGAETWMDRATWKWMTRKVWSPADVVAHAQADY